MVLGILGFLAALFALGLALKLANPLPDRGAFPDDPPLPETESALADAVASATAQRPGTSGIVLLTTGLDAFAMRMAMVRGAQRSIDAQYYIWENDLSGSLLLAEIILAADRGVRVRLLVDDNPTAGLDPMWAAVVTHPRIDVRIFNPMTIRSPRLINYLFDFPRLNRRMHNKSLTVDSAMTVVGGRNVGDVYFGAANERLFIDLDALAIGDVVPEVESEFARYWASRSSYPAQLILPEAGKEALDNWRAPQFPDSDLAHDYGNAAQEAFDRLYMMMSDDGFSWADIQLLADDPRKGLEKVAEEDLLAARLGPMLRDADKRIDMVSGYFVPAERGTELLAGIAQRGVATRIVTNSVQVTDVPLVHAGYIPSRRPLVDAGARLFEAQPQSKSVEEKAGALGSLRFSGGGESVHAKTFAIDGERLFVGSFNFDPRSAYLNCEMGFVIQSPELAQALTEALDERLDANTLEVVATADGDLAWIDRRGDDVRRYETEPGTSAAGRFVIGVLSKLPIAWML